MTTETMTDLITAEEAQKLLEGTTPGPWQADGDIYNRIVWSDADNRVCFMSHSNGLDDARDIATSNLVAAAPDLCHTVIALHAQLADAQAAQAMVGERCAEVAESRHEVWANGDGFHDADGLPAVECDVTACQNIATAIRALAPIDGLALVRELRAERDAASSVAAAAYGATLDWEQILEDDALWQAQDDIAKSRVACMAAEADRDRLAAANAVLEAKVAGLVGALGTARNGLSWARAHLEDKGMSSLNVNVAEKTVDAALATQEAGT